MKIAFAGTHGTGKTTLLDQLKEIYSNNDSFGYITGIARKIIKKGYPLNAEANTESYIHYINDQLIAESNISDYKLFISDRTLLDPLAYALTNRELPRPYIQDYFIDMIKNIWLLEKERYDLYIYFPIEFPLVYNGVSPLDEEYRKAVDRMIHRLLKEYSINFVIISGDMNERKKRILDIIGSVV
jgi:nicotinamide riboside kinase